MQTYLASIVIEDLSSATSATATRIMTTSCHTAAGTLDEVLVRMYWCPTSLLGVMAEVSNYGGGSDCDPELGSCGRREV